MHPEIVPFIKMCTEREADLIWTTCFFYRIAWLTPKGDYNIAPQIIQNGKIKHNLHLVSIQMARAVKEKLFLFEKKVQSLGNGLHALDLCLERESFQTFPLPLSFCSSLEKWSCIGDSICLGQYICVSVEQDNHVLHPHVFSWQKRPQQGKVHMCLESLLLNNDAIWGEGRKYKYIWHTRSASHLNSS